MAACCKGNEKQGGCKGGFKNSLKYEEKRGLSGEVALRSAGLGHIGL
jgi:hypothetical protein